MLGKIARKVFGTPNDRKIKTTRPLVEKINALEPEFEKLDDAGLIAKTAEFKERVAKGESLDHILPEAFANCREAARRALGLRAFDVQLMGGIFLHQGNISEMKTGEGKTLVATFPAYLNALTGRGVHIVTVNDYLATRDAEWMSKVYNALGMTCGTVYPRQPEDEKAQAYACDITYATNNELGFDYLRDNMKSELNQIHQRDHYYAIVDEVDSILIDEARTPLIISGPSEDRSELYISVDKLIPALVEEHYEVDEKTRNVTFTDEGNEYLEEHLHARGLLPEGQTLYDPESTTVVHHVNQAIRAHKLFLRDKDYIVRNDKVTIIDDEFLRIGSTNLNNRSQGLDTECDVATVADTDEGRAFVRRLRHRLIAHFMAVDGEAYGAAEALSPSVGHAILSFGGDRLVQLGVEPPTRFDRFVAEWQFGDPHGSDDAWWPWLRRLRRARRVWWPPPCRAASSTTAW